MQIDFSKNDPNTILIALTKVFHVDEIGFYTYDTILNCVGYNRVQDDLVGLWSSINKNLIKMYLSETSSSLVMFKPYRFISIKDAAYYLRKPIADVKANLAGVLLSHVLNEGIHIDMCIDDHRIFKAHSIEEILIQADLM